MLIRKGRWRTLFGMKGEFWYYSADSVEPKAQHPHTITIALGLLSPMLALAAIAISYWSLKTSESAVKIGNRPVLSFELSTTLPFFPLKGEDVVKIALTIRNNGNSLATLDSLMFSAIPGLWGRYEPISKEIKWSGMAFPKYVEAKTAVDVPIAFDFDKETYDVAKGADFRSAKVVGVLIWHDSFGDQHQDSWCTEIHRYPDSTFVHSPCDASSFIEHF